MHRGRPALFGIALVCSALPLSHVQLRLASMTHLLEQGKNSQLSMTLVPSRVPNRRARCQVYGIVSKPVMVPTVSVAAPFCVDPFTICVASGFSTLLRQNDSSVRQLPIFGTSNGRTTGKHLTRSQVLTFAAALDRNGWEKRRVKTINMISTRPQLNL